MKLEDQVTSLELSKKLKELGVKQYSYFTYALNGMSCGYDCPNKIHNDPMHNFVLIESWKSDEYNSIYSSYYSAFTVAELMEITFNFVFDYLEITTEVIDGIDGKFYRLTNNKNDQIVDHKNPANAYAIMLLYLLESGRFKLKEIKP